MTEGVQKAVEAAGSARKLAKIVGVQRQAVDQWKRGLTRPSPGHCQVIVAEFPAITLNELRPDIYPE